MRKIICELEGERRKSLLSNRKYSAMTPISRIKTTRNENNELSEPKNSSNGTPPRRALKYIAAINSPAMIKKFTTYTAATPATFFLLQGSSFNDPLLSIKIIPSDFRNTKPFRNLK